MSDKDWRLPENRREAFQRLYSFHLEHQSHPGGVYHFFPDMADWYGLDADGRAWLTWLNGNTQNPATSLLLLEAAPRPEDWRKAVAFWDEHFRALEWDIDRRHQKARFGEATEKWWQGWGSRGAADGWLRAAEQGWRTAWEYSKGQPYMGRLSAWSMYEYARILLGPAIPDIGSLMLEDRSGSRSHRAGLAVVAGYDAAYWGWEDLPPGLLVDLEMLAEDLLVEAHQRNPGHPDVSKLTLESTLCCYKSWHKPNRRYANVYADMAYNRIKKAEARFGDRFGVLWASRRRVLPAPLRLEANILDPGLVPVKQNHYRLTGEPIMLYHRWPDMKSEFDEAVEAGAYGVRKDPKWTL